MTALVVGGCFVIAMFFSPLFLSIPSAATAPALIIVGLLMAEQIKSAVAKCFVSNSRGISISFGFKQAEYTREETTASLVSVADTDMYRDKRENRSAD